MNANADKLIAVFDVGKTNAKVSLVDPALGREVWSARRPNEVVESKDGRELDVLAIEAWLLESLRAGAGARTQWASSCPSRMARRPCSWITRAKCWPRQTTKTRGFDEVATEYARCAIPIRSRFRLTCRRA